jgi:hypothetical protein
MNILRAETRDRKFDPYLFGEFEVLIESRMDILKPSEMIKHSGIRTPSQSGA